MLPPRDLVFSFFQSEDPFPIDFEDAWRWIGYSRKDAAKRALEKDCIAGIEYNLHNKVEVRQEGSRSVKREVESISLSLDGFKMFCITAETPKGREVRLYFIECEKELKRRIAEEKQHHQGRILGAYVNKDKLPWEKKFEDEFYRQIYRLKGWDYKPLAGRRTPLLGKITNDIVYMRLQPGVLQELQSKNPILPSGRRRHCHHQFLTANIGNPHLRSHLSRLIMFMSPCKSWRGFMAVLDRFMPRSYNIQPDIFFELLEAGHIDFDEWERLVS